MSITALAVFATISRVSPLSSIESAFGYIVFGVGGALVFYTRLSKLRRSAWDEAGMMIVAAAFLGLCTVAIPIGYEIGKEMWPGRGFGSPMRLLAVVAIFTIGGVLLLLVLAGPAHLAIAILRAFRRFLDSRTVLATGPLQELLQETLSSTTWKCPTFATVATSRDVFVSDKWRDAAADEVAKSLKVTVADLSRDFVKKVQLPDTERAWVPVHERLDGRPIDEVVEIILASAALPFGLVPHVTRNGEHYVDGGVVDNIPWFPALEFEIDELIIILLTPYDSEASAIAELNLSARRWSDRLSELLDFDTPIPTALRPEEIETLRRDTKWFRSRRPTFPYQNFPVIRVLYPTRPLGGFLRGTMNFDGQYARELMRLGMKDAYARFAAAARRGAAHEA